MNYVSHTRAAHECLRRQPAARPQHVSLYWALFFQWNAGFFEGPLELDHEATMKAARIGNKRTYRATLHDLETWGLIAYLPSQSRYDVSRCELVNLSGAEVPPMKRTKGKSAPHGKTSSGAEVPQPLRAEVPPVATSSGAEVPQHSLLSKTSFKTDVQNVEAPLKKKQQGNEDDGLSSAEVLDEAAPPDDAVPDPGAAPKKKVAPKKKGVRAETIRAAATAGPAEPRRQKPGRRPETTFQESEIFDKQKFVAAFKGTDYALADLNHYHEAVNLWRDKTTGEPPRRADWVATAKRFMFNDATDNRLKLAPNVQHHDPANPGPNNAGGGPARSGYVSKWDR